MRRPTIKDIAVRAQVSGWTVSQVLNGRRAVPIAAKTRDRVLKIAEEVGYRPNFAARALVNARTQLVAIWMPMDDHYSPYYGSIQRYLQRGAIEHGYRCITEAVLYDDAHRPDFSGLINWPMDGVIACDVRGPVGAYSTIDINERMPIVNLGAWCVESIDFVRLDLYHGSLAAVRHLANAGCKRIVFMGSLPFDLRAGAYGEVMRELGSPEEYVACPQDSKQSGRETALEYIRASGAPDGFFCNNDELAIGCSRALCELGIRVPEDAAIVGCDGIDDTEFQARRISTIKAPVDEMCATAWNLLEQRIAHPHLPVQSVVMTPELIVRESSMR